MTEKELGGVAAGGSALAEGAVTYTYDRRRYLIDVLFPTYVSCAGLPLSVILFIAGVLPPLMLLLAVVCGYSVLNAFVAHSYPRKITLDGESLRLESFGHVDEYPAGSITRLRLSPHAGGDAPLRPCERLVPHARSLLPRLRRHVRRGREQGQARVRLSPLPR